VVSHPSNGVADSAIHHAVRDEFFFFECGHLALLPDAISETVSRKSGVKRVLVEISVAVSREQNA